MFTRAHTRVRRCAGVGALAGGLALCGTLLLGGVPSAHATMPPSGSTQLVTRATDGISAVDADATLTAVSRNGRYALYVTSATDALSGFTNPGWLDVLYRRDLLTDTVQLVSLRTDGKVIDDGVIGPDASLSADGRYVAFTSVASHLAPEVTARPRYRQLYVRDMDTGTTSLFSRSASGEVGNGDSVDPSISDDGAVVSFTTEASNITGTAVPQIVASGAALPAVALISTKSGAPWTPGNGPSIHSALSGDGTAVAFESRATDLTTVPNRGVSQLYLRRVGTTSAELVSRAAGGTGAGGADSVDPAIDRGGDHIAWTSRATDLTAGATPTSDQIVIRDLATSRSSLVTAKSGAGSPSSGSAAHASLSSDGTRVAFQSDGHDLVAGASIPKGTTQVYVRDTAPGATSLASVSCTDPTAGAGPEGALVFEPLLTGDGLSVAFHSNAHDLTTVPVWHSQSYLRSLPPPE